MRLASIYFRAQMDFARLAICGLVHRLKRFLGAQAGLKPATQLTEANEHVMA
jgi:hypothetical protein